MNAIWESKGPRRALITGASGGIGEAFARILADEGWELALAARNDGELHRVAGVLRAKHQIEAHPVAVDLSMRDAGGRLAAALDKRGFSPDVVINNAGFGLAGEAASLPLDEQLSMLDVNARTATDLSLRFLPAMRARGRGGVLNVASLAGFMPGPGMAVYFATKAYLLSFTESLAEEMAGTGLTISAFCPGMVRTGFQDRSGMGRSWMARFMPAAKPDVSAWAGWQGFKEGRTVIVPGILNTLLALNGRYSPRFITRRVTKKLLMPRGGDGRGKGSGS